jgi:prepilin-type processing-associated H-X9-DG protein
MDYLNKYGNGNTFIETGTYLGDTVMLALDAGYKQIHSCELNDELYKNACEQFRRNHKVRIWHGDSVDCLWQIQQQRGPGAATFWLDAHASGPLVGGKSGGSPVLDELRIIKHYIDLFPDDTIFIDDRRLFGSEEWSGVKEEDAIALLNEINPNYNILFLDGHIPGDVICATVR